MDFEQLTKYIRKQGCRVRIWNSRKYIDGAAGNFDITSHGPLINVATRQETLKKNTETLLHEYGHFLQYKDGMFETMDVICPYAQIHDDWINGRIELCEVAKTATRNTMLFVEWGAEMRAYKAGAKLHIKKFDPMHYLRGAMSYMICIKWSWENRLDWKRCLNRKFIKNPHIYTNKELFAPLTDEEKKLIRHIKK